MKDDDPQTSFQGFLNINKPAGCSSREIVDRVQKITGRNVKIGHAGTLDPMAKGVLVICLGRATRLVPYIHEFSKTYRAGFTLGVTSDTDDSTGELEIQDVSMKPTAEDVVNELKQFAGTILQTPPQYSAVKVNGRRAYKAARKGNVVEIKSRPVTIHSLKLDRYEYPDLVVDIRCGSGTYIRSIARDLGKALGTGGLMHCLTRTEIGPFRQTDAISTDEFERCCTSVSNLVLPVETIFADWPIHRLSDGEIQLLRNGKRLVLETCENRIVAMTVENQFAAVLVRTAGSTGNFRASINWVPSWFAE